MRSPFQWSHRIAPALAKTIYFRSLCELALRLLGRRSLSIARSTSFQQSTTKLTCVLLEQKEPRTLRHWWQARATQAQLLVPIWGEEKALVHQCLFGRHRKEQVHF